MILLSKLIMGMVGSLALTVPSLPKADVAFIAILKVPEENQSAFEALAVRMVDAASANDGLLVYEFARSGNRVFGYERYVDAAAHGRHEEIISAFLPELMDLATFETIVTISELSEEHQAGFEEIGAEIGTPVAGIAKGTLDR